MNEGAAPGVEYTCTRCGHNDVQDYVTAPMLMAAPRRRTVLKLAPLNIDRLKPIPAPKPLSALVRKPSRAIYPRTEDILKTGPKAQ